MKDYWFDQQAAPMEHHLFASNLLKWLTEEFRPWIDMNSDDWDNGRKWLKSYFRYYTDHLNTERINSED